MLAQRSKELLARYRRGETNGGECPLRTALGSEQNLMDEGEGVVPNSCKNDNEQNGQIGRQG
jgi:hypothetical protein